MQNTTTVVPLSNVIDRHSKMLRFDGLVYKRFAHGAERGECEAFKDSDPPRWSRVEPDGSLISVSDKTLYTHLEAEWQRLWNQRVRERLLRN